MGVEFDEATRRSFDPVLEEVRARQLAKEQVFAELQELEEERRGFFRPRLEGASEDALAGGQGGVSPGKKGSGCLRRSGQGPGCTWRGTRTNHC